MANKLNIKTLASQFKGLNKKDPSAWPAAPKFALMGLTFALLLGAGYAADWQGQLEELDLGKQQEVKLKEDYVGKYRQAINLDLYKKQLDEANVRLGYMLRQLPNRSQMDALITDINSAGINRGLQFELFKPAANETKTEVYAELPIAIKVTGTYHDMGRFVSDIGQLSRIVTLNDVSMGTATPGAPSATLTMEATAKTFRYLDEEELAAARMAKSKKGKPGAAPGKE